MVTKKPVVKNKVVKKKEIPDTFTYNNYEFKKVNLTEPTPDDIQIERKVHFDKGFYTKVVKSENKLFLFISTKKRIGFKPKSKAIKSK